MNLRNSRVPLCKKRRSKIEKRRTKAEFCSVGTFFKEPIFIRSLIENVAHWIWKKKPIFIGMDVEGDINYFWEWLIRILDEWKKETGFGNHW